MRRKTTATDIPPPPGRLVNPGTPPPHKCDSIHAPGRPSVYDVNPGAVWECACGKFYKMKNVNVVDLEGDPAGTENRWIRCKNANGDEYQQVEDEPHRLPHPQTLRSHLHPPRPRPQEPPPLPARLKPQTRI